MGTRNARVLLVVIFAFSISIVNVSATIASPRNGTAGRAQHPEGGFRWFGKTQWFAHGTFCYRFSPEEMAWGDAEVYCQGLATRAHLASIHTHEESEFFNELFIWHAHFARLFWIGAMDYYKARHFQWTDGTLLNFQSWYNGQPDNTEDHCVACNYKNNRALWGVAKCDRKLSFMCKTPHVGNDMESCPPNERKAGQPKRT